MSIVNDSAYLLAELGFTDTQARLYLTLLRCGKTDARELSERSGIHRTEVYRALNELYGKGLVDKEVNLPIKFMAVSPSIGLKNSLKLKFEEVKKIEAETEAFLKQFKLEEFDKQTEGYSINLLNGRKRLLQKIKKQHAQAEKTIEIITILPRWLQILEECFDDYCNALERGVRYRVILGDNRELVLPSNVKHLMAQPDFSLKRVNSAINIHSAIFDGKEATFTYYPNRPIGKSPMIVTNHPTFLLLSQQYFELLWNEISSHSLSSIFTTEG